MKRKAVYNGKNIFMSKSILHYLVFVLTFSAFFVDAIPTVHAVVCTGVPSGQAGECRATCNSDEISETWQAPSLCIGTEYCCVKAIDSTAACTAAKGTCAYGTSGQPIGNCQLTTETMLGTCDVAQKVACCKTKVITSGVGSDDYCVNTLKGNCKSMASGGCLKVTEANVGACTNGPGIPPKTRVCCKSVPPATTVTGPMLSTYKLLEKIPGSNYDEATSGKLNVYLQDIYNFAFWAIGIAVVFMLTIGGFLYLTSAGNTSRIGTAKTIIFDAFLGLILALVAWIFLNLINPDLVKMNLPSTVKINPTIPVTSVPITSDVQQLATDILSGATKVSLSGSGDCFVSTGTPVSPAQTLTQVAAGEQATACYGGCPASGFCTAKTQISAKMLQSLVSVADQYPMTISSFTGGSHTGGSSHYQGRAADIVPSSPKATWPDVIAALRKTTGGLLMCDNAGKKVDCSAATHIHAEW